jgi:hypothetical protein
MCTALSGQWFSKGTLRKEIHELKKKEKKVSFIMHNVNFCTKIMNTVFREILVFGGNRSTHYLTQI